MKGIYLFERCKGLEASSQQWVGMRYNKKLLRFNFYIGLSAYLRQLSHGSFNSNDLFLLAE